MLWINLELLNNFVQNSLAVVELLYHHMRWLLNGAISCRLKKSIITHAPKHITFFFFFYKENFIILPSDTKPYGFYYCILCISLRCYAQEIITLIPSKIAFFWNILKRSMNTIIQHRDAQKASAEIFCAAFREKSAVKDLNMARCVRPKWSRKYFYWKLKE